ncbi:hypothetical protein WA026_008531 [Henosepilachna vigintioctopunctata]|uniref:Uncharacterized protein n=1 Tax=Henosepilachna vigintioctopunctata TaxID=420089 RepID=A0AAW1U8U0_9CUCU
MDPGELKIVISGMKNVKKGGVMINCDGNRTKKKIAAKATKEVGNIYEVVEGKSYNPKIAIREVETKYLVYEDGEI